MTTGRNDDPPRANAAWPLVQALLDFVLCAVAVSAALSGLRPLAYLYLSRSLYSPDLAVPPPARADFPLFLRGFSACALLAFAFVAILRVSRRRSWSNWEWILLAAVLAGTGQAWAISTAPELFRRGHAFLFLNCGHLFLFALLTLPRARPGSFPSFPSILCYTMCLWIDVAVTGSSHVGLFALLCLGYQGRARWTRFLWPSALPSFRVERRSTK